MLNQSINFYTFLLLIFVSSQAKSGSLGFSNENVPLFESHVSGDAGNHGTVIRPSWNIVNPSRRRYYCKMAARRIGKYVPDWVKLATKCPEAERPHYNRLRTNFENIKTQLDGVAPKPEPINWDLYAKNISKPGMVEAFKKAYGAVTVPYPIDTLTSKINEAEKEMETLAKESIEEANEAIALCEAELAKIRSMKPYEEMSIDEFLDLHPEIKKFVDEKMQSGEWPDRTL